MLYDKTPLQLLATVFSLRSEAVRNILTNLHRDTLSLAADIHPLNYGLQISPFQYHSVNQLGALNGALYQNIELKKKTLASHNLHYVMFINTFNTDVFEYFNPMLLFFIFVKY